LSGGRELRALVAEDEPHARQTLREYLGEVPWLKLVGEAADGREAVRLVDELEPDLLFLDVRLPELSGLEVARRIQHAPEIVFTTAYDRFAVAAFELGALDYLLKPFGRARFQTTLERIEQHLARSPETGVGAVAVERARDALSPAPLRRLFARTRDRIVPIPVDQIRRIEAQGDYACVHSPAGVHLLHVSLGELLERLDPERFQRVHRSHIVNLDAVQHMRPYDERRLLLVLSDGSEVIASRAASEALRKLAR
jgi:two-component system LytT family response regulator